MDMLLIAGDGGDAGAPARRAAAHARHLANIRAHAADGWLLMSGPRLRADGSIAGSLQVSRLPDRDAMNAYLAREPFALEGVWTGWDLLDLRLAALPWAPQPGRAGAEPGPLHAFAVIARDGPGAQARRLAARSRHFARLSGEVAAGRVRLGGAILDGPDGAMMGSLLALALPDEVAVQAWLEEEPYVAEGVWENVRIERWRIGAQPYPPLPGAA
jgi:uncharacterized protein YciI